MTHHLLLWLLLLSAPLASQTWQPPRTPDGQPDMQGYWQLAASLAWWKWGDDGCWTLTRRLTRNALSVILICITEAPWH